MQTETKKMFDLTTEIDKTGYNSWSADRSEDSPQYRNEIVMRSRDHGRNVFIGGGLVLGIKKVIHNTSGYDTLPVLLQEDITRVVYQK